MTNELEQLKNAAVTASDAPTGVDVVLLADALRIVGNTAPSAVDGAKFDLLMVALADATYAYLNGGSTALAQIAMQQAERELRAFVHALQSPILCHNCKGVGFIEVSGANHSGGIRSTRCPVCNTPPSEVPPQAVSQQLTSEVVIEQLQMALQAERESNRVLRNRINSDAPALPREAVEPVAWVPTGHLNELTIDKDGEGLPDAVETMLMREKDSYSCESTPLYTSPPQVPTPTFANPSDGEVRVIVIGSDELSFMRSIEMTITALGFERMGGRNGPGEQMYGDFARTTTKDSQP